MQNTMASLGPALDLPEDFLHSTWGVKPALFEQAGSKFEEELFNASAVTALLANPSIRPPFIRVVSNRQEVKFTDYARRGRHDNGIELIDVPRLIELFRNGASVVLQGLDETWAPLADYCRELEAILDREVHANCYVTPPNTQGLPAHTDDHDVLAIQVFGSKRWLVYPCHGMEEIPSTSPLDLTLTRGGVLYVPRGCPHVAGSNENTSVHLALAILPNPIDTPLTDQDNKEYPNKHTLNMQEKISNTLFSQ